MLRESNYAHLCAILSHLLIHTHAPLVCRCTLLNNSGTILYPGDMLEWTFYNQKSYSSAASKGASRGASNPRRVTVKVATAASERVIGRALSFAKPGETFDLLLKSC